MVEWIDERRQRLLARDGTSPERENLPTLPSRKNWARMWIPALAALGVVAVVAYLASTGPLWDKNPMSDASIAAIVKSLGESPSIALDKFVQLANITVDIPNSFISAVVVIKFFPGESSEEHLLFPVFGSYTKSQLFATGSLSSPFLVPGMPSGLNVTRSNVSISASMRCFASSRSKCTNVTATDYTFDSDIELMFYGNPKDQLSSRISLPLSQDSPTQAVPVLSHASAEFNLMRVFPHLPSTTPAFVVLDAFFVFVPTDGNYALPDVFAGRNPQRVESLFAGANLFFTADLSKSSGFEKVQALVGADDLRFMQFRGVIQNESIAVTADIQNWVIDPAFTILSGHLGVQSVPPVFIVDGYVNFVEPAAAEQNLMFVVDGEFGQDELKMRAKLNGSWTWGVGAAHFSVRDAQGSFRRSLYSNESIVASLSVTAVLGEVTMSANWSYPHLDALNNVVNFEIRQSTTLAKLIDPIFGSAKHEIERVAEDIVDQLLDISFENASVYYWPDLHQLKSRGILETAAWGSGSAALIVNTSSSLSGWGFAIDFYPDPSWDFSKASFVPRHFPSVGVKSPHFVLSSGGMNMDFECNTSSIPARASMKIENGLNFHAFMIPDSHGALSLFKAANPSSEVVSVSGLFHDLNDWFFSSQLSHGIVPLFHEWSILGIMFTISSTGNVSYDAVFRAEKPSVFEAAISGAFIDDSSGDSCYFVFNGSLVHPLRINLLHLGYQGATLDAATAHVEITVPRLGLVPRLLDTTASLQGEVQVGDLKLSASIDLDVTDGVSLTADLLSDSATVHDGVTTFAGLDGGILATTQLAHRLLAAQFDEFELEFVDRPRESELVLRLSGSVKLPSLANSTLAVVMKFLRSEEDLNWAYVIGLSLGNNRVSFSQVMPSIDMLDSLAIGVNAAIVLSSAMTTLAFPEQPTPLMVTPGLTFYGTLHETENESNDLISYFSKLTGIQEFILSGIITSDTNVKLEAAVAGDTRLGNIMDIYQAGLVFSADAATADFAAGIECQIGVNFRHQNDRIVVGGEFVLSDKGDARFTGSMLQPWKNPLGARGLTIKEASLSLGVNIPTMIPSQIGLGGGLYVGEVGGTVDIFASDSGEVALQGSLDNINMQVFIEEVIDLNSPPRLVKTLIDLQFKHIGIGFNPLGTTVVFNDVVIPAGFRFDVQDLELWEIIRGSGSILIDDDTFILNATVQPIRLADGLFELSGYDESTPARFTIEHNPASELLIIVDGRISLFDFSLSTKLLVDDETWNAKVDASALHKLFSFQFDLNSIDSNETTHQPRDFSIYADINTEVFEYMKQVGSNILAEFERSADYDLNIAKKNVDQNKNRCSSLLEQIRAQQAVDSASLSDAQFKVSQAMLSVSHAKQKVDSLQQQIDSVIHSMQSTHWWNIKQIRYSAELVGLEAAKGIADGALESSEMVLEGAKKIVKLLPDLDPRIIALYATYGAEEAGLNTASISLSSVETISNLASNIREQLAKHVGDTFSFNSLEYSAMLSDIKKGDLGSLRINATVLGKRINFAGHFDLLDVDHMARGLINGLLSEAHKSL